MTFTQQEHKRIIGWLRLTLADIERRNGAWRLVGNGDLTELTFIAHYILLQSHEQTLGVLRCKNDAAAYLCLGYSGKYAGKIEYEITA